MNSSINSAVLAQNSVPAYGTGSSTVTQPTIIQVPNISQPSVIQVPDIRQPTVPQPTIIQVPGLNQPSVTQPLPDSQIQRPTLPAFELPTGAQPSAAQRVLPSNNSGTILKLDPELFGFANRSCEDIERSYVLQLETYLKKKLSPLASSQSDCFATELQKISEITGSPTALIYVVTLADRLEVLLILPDSSAATALRSNLNSNLKSNLRSKQNSPAKNSKTSRHVNYAAPAPEVNRIIREFKLNLQDPTTQDYLTQSQQLYNWIVRPLETELKAAQIETLVFAMDGDLRVIPPAAFHDGKLFLAQKYASATVPAMMLTNLTQRSPNLKILAMGLSEAVQGLAPLPAAKIEVTTIAFKVLKGKAFLDQAFTLQNLQAQLPDNYGIVHLATHAEFNGQSPDNSFIQFWDHRLRMSGLGAMKMSVEMLTLSACQTAVGNNMGLSGTAVDSGAKSVLASLWSISDRGTAPLMISFYSRLQTSRSKAIALREAQLSLINGTVKIDHNKLVGIRDLPDLKLEEKITQSDRSMALSHPFFWSSFILVGNWL